MNMSEKIKMIRKKKGLRQEDIAVAIGTTRQNYARYENGKIMPKADTLLKIADALGTSVLDLMRDETAALDKSLQAVNDLLSEIYGSAEYVDMEGKEGGSGYYRIGTGKKAFVLETGCFNAIYEAIKAMIPPLVNVMKSNMSEEEFSKRLQSWLDGEIDEF